MLLDKANRQPTTHYKLLSHRPGFFRCTQVTQLTESIQRLVFRLLNGRENDLILDSTCWEIGQKWQGHLYGTNGVLSRSLVDDFRQ
jgi:hypothetical protein